jgi:hypothetical protein
LELVKTLLESDSLRVPFSRSPELDEYITEAHFAIEESLIFLYILAQRWDRLSDDVKDLMINKVDRFHCPQNLFFQVSLTGFSSELFIKAINRIFCKSPGLQAIEAAKRLNLTQSVLATMAAQWFFVDDFEYLSKYWSEHEFIRIALNGLIVNQDVFKTN